MTTSNRITPLRQRMIEDMSARNLGQATQRGHIYSCKLFAGFPPELIDQGNAVRHQTSEYAAFEILTTRATGRQSALLRQLGDKPHVRNVFWLVAYNDRIRTFLRHCRKHAPIFCFLNGAFKGWTYQ